MQIAHQFSVQALQQNLQTIAISATFTAEPVENSLAFWVQELELSLEIEFAPYNQVFQQLLDPSSVLSQNRQGVNIVLLRFEDWRKQGSGETLNEVEAVERNVHDFITALKAAVFSSSTPHLVCLCPDSPGLRADANWVRCCQDLEERLVAELAGISDLYLIRSQDFQQYPVEVYYDAQRDALGHIPFTSEFFTALATLLARRIYTIKRAPHKVIVLDCDNTIWKGVVGEDGVNGIQIPPAWRSLQDFMAAQQEAGMILCLCSKNTEADVLEVFEQRTDMRLKLEHIVSWRINWVPKSENIRSLAEELNLGLDSFIFIDDNPVECAEVQANCPEVLTLQLPIDGDISTFLEHVWAFDHLKITEEDKQRTALYKQNVERDRFQQTAVSIDDFLAGLQLRIEISEPSLDQLPRVAQLTQRTNQFNFTTVRWSESEIQQLSECGLECRIVEVSDRFGDYGLVGIIIFSTESERLSIDTFLLSCRVLGRGVEHRMLQYLGEIAKERHLKFVDAAYIPTKKNLPARNFLEGVVSQFKQTMDEGDRFHIPVEFAAAISYTSANWQIEQPTEKPASKVSATLVLSNQSQRLNRIAKELYSPKQILHSVEARLHSIRPDLTQPFVAPRTEQEKQLAQIWAELLHIDSVGAEDNYFDLGGTSLLAVELFAQIEKAFDKKLPLTTLLEAPTIAQLAQLMTNSGSRESVVLIRSGGAKSPVFLVHDGDGETMLYRNLANRLKPDHAVYGLQPYSDEDCPILHTRIEDMAAYYVDKIQAIQPQGPYLLGGMCAGGVIAFEMAQQLKTSGQEVAIVALMDAADAKAPKRVGRVTNIRLQRLSNALSQNQHVKTGERVIQVLNTIRRKATNLIVYEMQTKVNVLWNQLKLWLFQYYLDRGLPLPNFLHNLSVRRVYEFAEQIYNPTRLYNGDILLIRATEGDGSDEPYVEVYSDPLLGWSQRVTEEIKVLDVPGGHSSMLQEPNVEVMADKLQAYIDDALSNAIAPTRP
ncbi:HAD-IIIC family phosphatase [Leptolyngbya sp. FACHB-36]|uniref:HAD-IIIC family phosphatase n=1 Tax=Leptolyngbya sp. FACHB-36 TaxID=2692808 RepID=UPI00168147D2|nr:HAD-IIIC family phosphatase [Leptolyngbya sp. FACHB-36]MBD2022182.1 HAD-IIIC family phosphatase [Leptolyngbya sp. FACHB-36]